MDQRNATDGLLALRDMDMAAGRVEAAGRELDDLAAEGDRAEAIAESLAGHGVPEDAARRLAVSAADSAAADMEFAGRAAMAAAMRRVSREIAAAVREWRSRAGGLRNSLRVEAGASGRAIEDMVVVSDGEPAGFERVSSDALSETLGR